MRAVVLYPGEDGYWVAECPSLPGCISQGRTKPEALANVKEAIEGWLETAERELELRHRAGYEKHPVEPGEFGGWAES